MTQNLERLQDGISDSGSEEQALKIDPYRIHAEVPARPKRGRVDLLPDETG